MDVDVLCEMADEHLGAFLSQFGRDFYVSETAARDAVERKSRFTLIHLPTSFKVDIFVSRRRPFDKDRMKRAAQEKLLTDHPVSVRMTSAEDSIISKLEWYQRGNQTSERQWEDVSRLIRLLDDSVDRDYLRPAAESVGVSDLLERLISAS
ncbi:MAG: hypothetical protein GY903_03565 [Fuerstiella sp.]|nr:hypothetical protein [Fuerstiella sp.]MCP4853553.1 hypothetical protein [Fuerstiella sp.]